MGIEKVVIKSCDITTKISAEKLNPGPSTISELPKININELLKKFNINTGRSPSDLSAEAWVRMKSKKTFSKSKADKLHSKIFLEAMKDFDTIKKVKFNPINKENFVEVKSKLNKVFEGYDDIQSELKDISDPKELYEFVYDSYDEPSLTANVLKKVLNLKELPEDKTLRKKLFDDNPQLPKVLADKFSEIINSLIDVTTPKSTNPVVIRIENEIKDLGVKEVNLADDIESAKKFKIALDEMKKSGVKMPYAIKINDLFNTNGNSFRLDGVTIKNYDNTKPLIIMPSTARKKLKSDLLIKYIKEVKKSPEYLEASKEERLNIIQGLAQKFLRYASTSNKYHKIRHEMEHTLHSKADKFDSIVKTGFYRDRSIIEALNLSDNDFKITNTLSKYAASTKDGSEFMAEAFAKLMNGQQLSSEQMALYKKQGGFIPDLSWKKANVQ